MIVVTVLKRERNIKLRPTLPMKINKIRYVLIIPTSLLWFHMLFRYILI